MIYDYKDLRVDTSARVVWLKGEEIRLSKLPFDLLALLISDPHHAFTYREIRIHVWGWDETTVDDATTRTIQAHTAKLRKALGTKEYIHNVFGIGMQLDRPTYQREAA